MSGQMLQCREHFTWADCCSTLSFPAGLFLASELGAGAYSDTGEEREKVLEL